LGRRSRPVDLSLARLRKPDGAFDATMLLVADWDDELNLSAVEDPVLAQAAPDERILSAPRFFRDLLNAVMNNAPVDIHTELRLRKQGGARRRDAAGGRRCRAGRGCLARQGRVSRSLLSDRLSRQLAASPDGLSSS
jgi:hypothetical protein